MALSTISGTTGITDATITSAKLADFAAAVDLNGVELLLDADQDTSITADTDDRIDFKIAGVEHISISNSSGDTVIKPMVNGKDIVFQQYDGNKILEINDGNYVAISGAAAGPGELRFYEDTDHGAHYTGFKAGNATASLSYVLPLADGTDGYQLTTDGSGTLTWAVAGAAMTGSTNNTICTVTGANAFQGEANLTFDGSVLAATGNITATGTIEPAGDTAASDNAAIGYTAAEGLILTGQGSTNDVTIKNDADADVIEIPTGTTNVTVAGTLGTGGLITSGAGITGAGLLTTGGNIVIPDAGNIGSASDTDAIAIASDGVVTFSQAPVFSAGGAAGLALLQTVTASNDATVLVGSSSLFTSTHKVYILHVINAHPVTDSVEFRCRLSKGGSIISADYEYSRNQTIHSSSFTNRGSNSDDHVNLAESLGNANDESHNMVITMYNPAETTFKKLVNFSSAGMDLSPNMARNHGVFGHEGDSAAIDGIQFFYSSGNVSTGTFKLYGVV